MSQQIARKPVGWQETVGGVKQACWCGEEWHDNHEDGNHAEEEAQVPALPVLGKRKAEEVETQEGGESEEESDEEELEEGWQKGWYGPVRCEE